MKKPSVVAFTGPIGSGKSTAAAYLVQAHGYQLVKFAAPLKAMLRALGLTHEHLEGSLKELPCGLLGGKTPRHAMQTLGTEWGRELITPGLWTYAWVDIVSDVLDQGGRVVVDDLRFPNEAHVVKRFDGCVLRLTRPAQMEMPLTHASEQYAIRAAKTLANNSTLEAFQILLDSWMLRQ